MRFGGIFAFIVMSHGGPGYFYGVDGVPVSVKDDIITQVDGNHWPFMKGYPKIIMVHSCRGKCKYITLHPYLAAPLKDGPTTPILGELRIRASDEL